MSDTITITGFVATMPKTLTIGSGVAVTSFRLASNQRRFDKTKEKWVDGDTNWYTITTFRQLAANAGASVHKGERVIVSGRLRVRDWESGDRKGTSVEIEADAVGHDLSWGTTAFSRNMSSTSRDGAAAADPAGSVPTDHFRDDADDPAAMGTGGDTARDSASGSVGGLTGDDSAEPRQREETAAFAVTAESEVPF